MTTPAPVDVGEQVQQINIPADQIRQEAEPNAEPDETFGQQLEKELDQETEPAPIQVAAPAPVPAPGTAKKLPDEIPQVELDETEPAPKTPAAEKPAVEAIKAHTEFADARSLRPAYEALRVRCEAAEKAIADKEARIGDLSKQIEEANQIKEEAQQLRARVDNVNFRETEPYKQAIEPLRTEAFSIMARASELALADGKANPDKISEAIRQMVSLPDRGQRRRLAQEVFDEADVGEAVMLASQLADVDRRYRTRDEEFGKNSGEFLKTYKVQSTTKLREAAQIVQREMDKSLGAVAKAEALKDSREQGERMAEDLLRMDELPPRQRTAFIQDVYWRLARFDATLALAMDSTEKLKIANAALRRKGITPVTGETGGGKPGGNGRQAVPAENMTIGDELDAFFAEQPT